MRGVDLDPVEAARLDVRCRGGKRRDHLADLVLVHRNWNLTVAGRGNRRGAPELVKVVDVVGTAVASTGREQLHEDAAVVCMHGLGKLSEARDRPLVPRDRADRERALAEAVSRVPGCDLERGAALRSLGVVGDVAVAEEVVLGVVRRVAGDHDPMADRGRADLERTPDARRVAHLAVSSVDSSPAVGRYAPTGTRSVKSGSSSQSTCDVSARNDSVFR